VTRDTGTPELSKRRKVIPRSRRVAGYDHDLYVADGCEADRLLLGGRVTVLQHSDMMTFMVKLHRAGLIGMKGPSMERVSGSDPAYMSGKQAEALAVVSKIFTYLDGEIGQAARRELVAVCCDELELPRGRKLDTSLLALRGCLG